MSKSLFEVHGLTDLQKKLEFVSNNYPNEAEDLLVKVGNKFRKSVRAKTPSSKFATRRKLNKSYKVSKPQGYGKDVYIEFSSNSRHVGLVERGHKTVNGEPVKGEFMIQRTAIEYQKEFPAEVEKMVNRMVKRLLR